MPKHAGQATVASFDSQNWHCGASDDMAAPQFGQLRVCACMISGRDEKRGWPACRGNPRGTLPFAATAFLLKSAGRIHNCYAMLKALFPSGQFPGFCEFAFLRKQFFRKRRITYYHWPRNLKPETLNPKLSL